MNFKKTQMAVAVASVMSLVVGNVAFAQASASAERVTVTGSNIKRTSIETSSPVEVITAVDIKRTGAKSVLELMKTVTALGTDGFNDNPGQNGFSRGVATASLRSLSSSSTLILLNGRRMAASAYANPNNGTSTLYDLNSIPLSAIERVEILKDGASAVYGSDAVAGVINFITKQDYQGLEMNVQVGANDDGEFGKRTANISAGFGDFKSDGWNVLVSGSFSQRDATSMKNGSNDIQADQYLAINTRLNPFASSISKYPLFYKEFESTGLLSGNTTTGFLQTIETGTEAYPAGNIRITTGCGADRSLTATSATGVAAMLAIGATSSLINRTFCNYDTNDYVDVQTKGEDAGFISRGTFKISNTVTAFSELGYSKTDRTLRGVSKTIDGLNGQVNNFMVGSTAAPFLAVLPIGHPDNPFNADAVPRTAAIRYRFENIPTTTDVTNKQTRVLGGLRGTAGTWDWEGAVLWNQSKREEVAKGFLYLPVLRQLTDNGRTLASVAADPALSPALTNRGKSEVLMFDGKVNTEFGSLAGGPIAVAAGLEYRTEKLEIDPDPVNAAGQILGLSTTNVHGKRNIQSAFFEVRTPWMTNFETDFAGRFDSYPGLKTNFVPKVGAKWTATDSIVVRGTYSEGFVAPTLSQTRPGGTQFFLNGLIDPLRCESDGETPKPGATVVDCAKSVGGQGDGNPNLKPEKSKTYTLGLIFAPTSNIDAIVDLYKIKKVNEVALASGEDVIDHPNNYAPGSVVRDTNNLPGLPGTGSLLYVKTPWSNQGSTQVTGVDLELKVRNSLGEFGKLSSSVRAGYLLSYKREEIPGLPTFNVVGASGGLADWATSTGSIPRLKLRLSSTWEIGGHSLTGAANYVSSISQIRRYDGGNTGGPIEFSGATCHWSNANPDGLGNGNSGARSSLGAANATTGGLNNGRQRYVTYHPDCTVPAWTTYDLGYFYTGVKDLTVGVQVSNILDTKAPYAPTTNGSATANEGYNAGLHSNTGRYFLLSAGYKFK